ncbi:hypothetical protein BKA70DRAFT_1241146 [Coprinopsis sp. MPI-PUGE-AT-0042]|nr:hypothetical protein BKA70DRAFT_1241146 [Coprinopsis sp. MPI-PUGE-AT-0042]
MVSDLQLHLYANSNASLPEKLHEPLHRFLSQLDVQWKTHESERTQVVEAIESHRSMIEAMELEIEGLSRVEARLAERQQVLGTRYRRYATTITAIRRMPPEVVATIIHFAVQGPYGSLHRKDRLFFAQLRSVTTSDTDQSVSGRYLVLGHHQFLALAVQLNSVSCSAARHLLLDRGADREGSIPFGSCASNSLRAANIAV